MNYLAIAKQFVTEELCNIINTAFESVINTRPEYEVLIWGSTVRDAISHPNDLDVIIAVKNQQLSEPEVNSIEGIIKSKSSIREFDYVDALVTEYTEVEQILSNSRISEVYNVTQTEWQTF